MEVRPPSEAASHSGTQEFLNILCNLKVHYRVHKNPPPVPILSQINQVHTTHPILILSSHLRLDLTSGLFPSGFTTNILYAFLFPNLY
jgi:hypothetical protein